jgi:hypothetical protein
MTCDNSLLTFFEKSMIYCITQVVKNNITVSARSAHFFRFGVNFNYFNNFILEATYNTHDVN